MVRLFSYGTLRQENVQMATFGRLLEGRADALTGWKLAPLPIDDAYVVATSGSALHHIARPTGDPADRIEGTLFEISREELDAADRYEVDTVKRIETALESGTTAFVYVSAED